jgi:DNA invertase Pin-like site-specific DNA recombinase
MSMRAILYARVSSIKQEDGYSIPAQLDLLREYAAKHGIEIIDELTDIETAKIAGRKHFTKMMKRVLKDPSIAILVEKTDRLYRNSRDAVDLEEIGCEIHFVKEGKIVRPDSRTSDLLAHDIQIVLAKHFIRNLRDETKKGMVKKAAMGTYPSRPPIGYLNRDKRIAKDPLRLEMMRQCFLWRIEGSSIEGVVEKAYAEGLRSKNGGKVGGSQMHRLLSNEFYYGLFRWYDEQWKPKLYVGDHEPCVSKEEWDKAQRTTKTRRRVYSIAYRGLLTCSICGHAITAERQKGHTYYRCSKARTCRGKYIREDRLEDVLVGVIAPIEIEPRLAGTIRKVLFGSQHKKVEELEFRRQAIEKRKKQARAKLEGLYEDLTQGKLADDTYKRLRQKYEVMEETAINEELELRDANKNYVAMGETLIELCNDISGNYLRMNTEERVGLLKRVCLNLHTDGVSVDPIYKRPFDILAKRPQKEEWRPQRDLNPRRCHETAVLYHATEWVRDG